MAGISDLSKMAIFCHFGNSGNYGNFGKANLAQVQPSGDKNNAKRIYSLEKTSY